MFDSTNIYDIPPSAPMAAYYVDGRYAIGAATVRARFPSAVLIPISAVGTNAGIVADCELGDLTITQVVAWVRMRRAAGVDPTVYCNETYGWPGVRAAFQAAGVAEPHYWCANYDNHAVLRMGQVARQYANPTLTGHHYDLSVVADYWPGVDGPGGNDLDARQNELLVAIASSLIDIRETAGPPAIKSELDAILAAVSKPESPATEPATAPLIDPQVAADLHTIAGFLHKLGQ